MTGHASVGLAPQPANGHAARAKLPIAYVFAIWTAWGVWSLQQSTLLAVVAGQTPPPRATPWVLTMASAWFWALLTLVVMTGARLIRDHIAFTAGRALAHVGAFVAVHLVDVTTYSAAAHALVVAPRPWATLLVSLVTFNALCYTVVAVTITSLDSQQALRERAARQSQLEIQLALAQFHALRAQLHPHFLFNALNAISSLIYSDPVRADRMLARVSELLRIAIDTAPKPEITLHQELEFATRYLEIERMRYGDRLDVQIEVPGETFDALVPTMLLQPLVENAVRHGVAPHARPGRVEIRAAREGSALSIVVRDTGSGFDEPETAGVGLSTTRARLEKLYGASQQLVFANVPGGFETRVSLPLRRQEQVPV